MIRVSPVSVSHFTVRDPEGSFVVSTARCSCGWETQSLYGFTAKMQAAIAEHEAACKGAA